MAGGHKSLQASFALLTTTALFIIIIPRILAEQECSSSSSSDDNMKTTLQILRKACIYPRVKSDEVAQEFMNCYDQAPGKDIFINCQKEAFNGRLLDTAKNFKINCLQPLKFPKYVSCLNRDFEAAELDLDDATQKVNACQLPVVS